MLLNQWANVIRWEMRPRLFIRTTEFLWQEGHTAHETKEEAAAETLKMLDVYRAFVEEMLAVPVVTGRKSDSEKFAGAVDTYCIEALMRDGKSLQAGTSHYLGQNFAKAFNVQFQSREGKLEFAWQTSWGVSSRLVGCVVMAHGDDRGLMMPPKIAPVQAVVVPIWRKDEQKALVLAEVEKIRAEFGADVRLKVDDREQYSPGWKYYEHELRGVPVRLEVGPKDVEKGAVMSVRRLDRRKESIPLDQLPARLPALLEEVQADLFKAAQTFRAAQTSSATSIDDLVRHFVTDGRRGLVALPWDGDARLEAEIKERCAATLRCVPLDQAQFEGIAPAGRQVALFARAY